MTSNPSNTSISENGTPVEPTAASPAPEVKFPPPDHECDRQGVPGHYTGEWEGIEDSDLPQRIVQNTIDRVARPLFITQMYLSGKVLRIAEAHLPEDIAKDLYWHWRIAEDLETVLNQVSATVAAMVATNLPARFTSLDGTLRTAMVDGGLCCEEAANQLIASCLLRNEIALMEEHIPGFNREWLTIQGVQTHKDTLLEPAGPQVQSHPTLKRPAPKPTKLISPDSAQVTVRGAPVTKPTITLMDSGTLHDFATGIDHAPFFEATFKMEVADMEIDVFKNHHKSELLHEECGAIQMAGDVQVSGTWVNSSTGLILLVDQWFPITEADAAP